MAKRLTDKGVDGLARRAARYVVSDPELRGTTSACLRTGLKYSLP
jgi:hypothetical protein